MIQIQLNGAPAVANGPIDHLVACHRRIEQRLDTLERAGTQLEQTPEASLAAIANSLKFMEHRGVLHTVDEEESVFPRIRLRASAPETARLDELEAEHRVAEALYDRLKLVSASLPDRADEYRELVTQLGVAYRRHIASEELMLSEMGNRLLNDAQLQEIQAEMRARR